MKYCKYCGEQLENFHTCHCSEAQASFAKAKKTIVIAVSVVAVVVVIILVIAAISNSTKVNPFDYISIAYEGYNGGGKAVVSVNTPAILKKIMGDEPTDDLEELVKWVEGYEQHRENIQWDCTRDSGLSNGDIIVVSFTIQGDTAQQVQGGRQEFTVSGLPDIKTVDVFSECFITFAGVDGNGELDFGPNNIDNFLTACRFSYEPQNNLSNGSTVTVTITNEDYLIETFKMRPLVLTKTYTVSGLGAYITQPDQVPKDELVKLAEDFLEMKRENLADSSMLQYKDITVEGCYLVGYKSGWTDSIELWIVVSCKEYEYGEYEENLYFPLKFDDPILLADGTLGYSVEDGSHATFNSGVRFPTENMLSKYVFTEIDLLGTNFPIYNQSSGKVGTSVKTTDDYDGHSATGGSTGTSSSNPSTGNNATAGGSNYTATGVANTKTGISWDGVSPIVYTYADGSTGTTPVVGATYESRPGITATYTGEASVGLGSAVKDMVFHCDHCGRVCGHDGSNGQCVRWLTGGDHTCKSCGATVPGHTCHTCSEK